MARSNTVIIPLSWGCYSDFSRSTCWHGRKEQSCWWIITEVGTNILCLSGIDNTAPTATAEKRFAQCGFMVCSALLLHLSSQDSTIVKHHFTLWNVRARGQGGITRWKNLTCKFTDLIMRSYKNIPCTLSYWEFIVHIPESDFKPLTCHALMSFFKWSKRS